MVANIGAGKASLFFAQGSPHKPQLQRHHGSARSSTTIQAGMRTATAN
jgi:hypothetical protein